MSTTAVARADPGRRAAVARTCRRAHWIALTFPLILGRCSSDDAAASEPTTHDGSVNDAGAGLAPLFVAPPAGPLEGTRIGELRAFLGIPYALPPTGSRRFRAPEPAPAWSEPRDASAIPGACMQSAAEGAAGTEDCLTLDVWTPATLPAEPLPVMVWIHGGGFVAGSGWLGEPVLATRGVVLVAINYRLGPLGFLVHPALEAEDGTAGNQAVRDQLLALAWVKQNVAAFGGDASNVTVFGESAGGSAVCALLATPASAGLFRRAMVMSGTLCGREAANVDDARAQGERLATAAGCAGEDVAACLRALPAERLPGLLATRTLVADGASWAPVVDGALFPLPFGEAFERGEITRVPTLIGSTANEGLAFVLGLGLVDEAGYRAAVESSPFFGRHAEAVLAQYPASSYPTPLEAFGALTGHRIFNCPARRGARAIAATGVPVHVYYYTHPPALHASELVPLFGQPVEADVRAGDVLKDLWASFARDGSPITAGLEDWPASTRDDDVYLRIADDPSVERGLLAAECDFWDAHR